MIKKYIKLNNNKIFAIYYFCNHTIYYNINYNGSICIIYVR